MCSERIVELVRIEQGRAFAELAPAEQGFRLDVEIDFDSVVIGRQRKIFDLDAQAYGSEISKARTFGFMRDVERLWASGHALGSSLENSVVISDDNTVINVEGLRYAKDEFVRHKTLDAVGDLALAGAPFIGCYRSYRGGHKMNAHALNALLGDRSAYEVVEASAPRSRAGKRELIAVNAEFAPWAV